MDETSHQCHGRRFWTWILTTPWGASFHIEPSRGQCAAKDVLGKVPTGVLVTDRYAGYGWVDQAQRQVCWSHLLRDFCRMGQREGLAGRVGRALHVMGQWMFRHQHRGTLIERLPWLQARMRKTLTRGTEQHACAKTARTCRNLLALWPALWRFTTEPDVPPTNNLAERGLRGVVIHRKISFVTRSGRGMRFVEQAHAVAYTCRTQGRSVFDFLCASLEGHFGSPATLPSLLPSE